MTLQCFVIIMSTLIGVELAKMFGSPEFGKASSLFLVFTLTWVVVLDIFFEVKNDKSDKSSD